MNRYLLILNDAEPLLVLRVPLRPLKKGGYGHAVKWSAVLKAAIGILKLHGLSRKNLLAIEHVAGPEDSDKGYYRRWEEDNGRFRDFAVYEMAQGVDSFRLVRPAGAAEKTTEG